MFFCPFHLGLRRALKTGLHVRIPKESFHSNYGKFCRPLEDKMIVFNLFLQIEAECKAARERVAIFDVFLLLFSKLFFRN